MDKRRDGIERLNAALMVVSCIAAFLAPFHLFLFAYAVLGPLHYLTEISWLHDRDYFAPRRAPRRWWLVLVGTAMAVLMYGYISNDLLHRPVAPTLEIGLVYLVFLTAPLLVWVRHPVNAAVLAILAVAALALFSGMRSYALLAYFIVTIVHVLVFTCAFVLYGALKSRSGMAMASLVVFAACVAAIFAVAPPPMLAASDAVRRIYAFFEPLNAQLLALFGQHGQPIYEARAGLAVMRLIAFAYTYHYLNWFSKTSVIRWHEVPRARFAAIVMVWLAAVAVYLYDFTTGLSLLYLLSLLHVLLEFPLNHKTFAAIATELRGLLRGAVFAEHERTTGGPPAGRRGRQRRLA